MRKLIKWIISLFKRKKKKLHAPIIDYTNWSRFEIDILDEINKYRVNSNKPIILGEDQGRIEATERVLFQIKQYDSIEEINHDNIATAVLGLRELGFFDISEILGYGFSTAHSVVNGWKHSKKHNRQLLGNYKYIGIAQRKNKDKLNFFCVLSYN